MKDFSMFLKSILWLVCMMFCLPGFSRPMEEDGEFIKTRPTTKIDEYLVYEGRHDGIISEDLFNAAQEKMGKNHKAKSDVKVRNPFVSLMFCKTCGRAIVYQKTKKEYF